MKIKKYLLAIFLVIGIVCFSSSSFAQVVFDNPIEATTATEFVQSVLNALMGVVGVIAVVFVVIGGIMYMTSAGNEKAVEKAKEIMTGAVIGLAIVFAGPTFLKEILIIFNTPSGAPSPDLAPRIIDIAQRVLSLVLAIAGILGIISLVFGGIMYLTSAGDEKKTETAKSIVKYAVIGVVVSLGSLVIVNQIYKIIGPAM